MIELAVREYKADGGIIITASHNEPEYNGFKFLDKDGAVLRPKDINKIINDFNKIKDLEETYFLNKIKGRVIHKIEKRHEAKIKPRSTTHSYHTLIRLMRKCGEDAARL